MLFFGMCYMLFWAIIFYDSPIDIFYLQSLVLLALLLSLSQSFPICMYKRNVLNIQYEYMHIYWIS